MRGRPKHHEWCTRNGCFNKHYAKGLCQKHYRSMHHKMIGTEVMAKRCVAPRCEDSKFREFDHCLAHVLEREFHERGGDEKMLPLPGR